MVTNFSDSIGIDGGLDYGGGRGEIRGVEHRSGGWNDGYYFPWCRSPFWVCSTRSLTAPGERHLPQLFNIDRDIPPPHREHFNAAENLS